jgi:hypothetical protein
MLSTIIDESYTPPYSGGKPGLVPLYRSGPVRWDQREAEAVKRHLGGLVSTLPLPYHQMGRSPTDAPLASERQSLSRHIVDSQHSLSLAAERPASQTAAVSARAGGFATASLGVTQRGAPGRPTLLGVTQATGVDSQDSTLGHDFQLHLQHIQESAFKVLFRPRVVGCVLVASPLAFEHLCYFMVGTVFHCDVKRQIIFILACRRFRASRCLQLICNCGKTTLL